MRFLFDLGRRIRYSVDMSQPSVVYLGWEESALELVGKELLKMNEEEPEVFRRATVVTPTAESGRRLREWLAEHAKKPLLMPRMTLAGQLIRPRGEKVATELETLAAWEETLLERMGSEKDADMMRQLYGSPTQEESWALGTAQRMMELHRLVVQNEVDLDALEAGIEKNSMALFDKPEEKPTEREQWARLVSDETGRWHGIKTLFREVDHKLRQWGRTPVHEAEEAEMRAPHARHEKAVIIIACLPELSRQVQRYLRLLEQERPGSVRIWVNAPGEEASRFDEMGCVIPERWEKYEDEKQKDKEEDEKLTDNMIRMASTAQRMAQGVVEEVCRCGQGGEVIMAACDASFVPALVTEFGKAKYAPERGGSAWRVHVPEGRSYQGTEAAAAPGLLAAACGGRDTMAEWEPLLRNAAMQRCYGGESFDAHGFGKLMDMLIRRYFPARMSYLEQLLNPERGLPGLSPSPGALPGTPVGEDRSEPVEFELVDMERRRTVSYYRYAQRVREVVTACREDMSAGLSKLAEALRRAYASLPPLADAVSCMAKQMEEVSEFLRAHPGMTQRQAWALLLHLTREHGKALVETQRENTHLDALGWKELAYAKGKMLILAGFHDGCVPERPPIDSFLPDTLRKTLGMPCMETREARDYFMLTALLNRKGVTVSIHLSRLAADGSGTPLAPSSLLFRCKGDKLVRRVQTLFQEQEPEDEPDVYYEWKLRSLPPEEEAQVAVDEGHAPQESVQQIAPGWDNPRFSDPNHGFTPSEIKNFLLCPLRFWMQHALRIDPKKGNKENKVEMEAHEYGTLLHSVLEDVARRYPTWEKVDGEDAVLGYAKERLRVRSAERYGAKLPAPQKIQYRKMYASLHEFAEWHCEGLKEGWECYDCEHKVDDWMLDLPDGSRARVSMRADRIDRNRETGKWRIIDYKTHDKTPDDEHLAPLTEMALRQFEALMPEFPLEAQVDEKSKLIKYYRWGGVQLPMYAAWLMEREKSEQAPEMAYLCLPRNGRKLRYEPFSAGNATPAAMQNALETAKQAIMLMRRGLCLYSAESLMCRAYSKFSVTEGSDDPRQLFAHLREIPNYYAFGNE